MKNRRASILLILISVTFLFLIVIGMICLRRRIDRFFIGSSLDDDIRILPYQAEEHFYYFIPSGMDYDDLFVVSSKTAFCNEKKINNLPLSNYVTDEEMVLKIGDQEGLISFIRSEGVHTLFVDTLKMDMDYLHRDKDNKINIRIRMFDQQGEAVLDPMYGFINGRGNNSWDTPKKSYSLSFDDPVDLLDMGPAFRWALIPNYSDRTKINNKIVYSFAKESGLEWTPECEYINVYFDGEYCGLYLLSEKIEVDEERLPIGENGLLFKKELPMRLDIVDNGILTDHGNVIEITYPKEVSSYHKELIAEKVQTMEDSLLDLNSDAWRDVIDLDSWAKCYLIDELFDNLDAGIASANFYMKEDGRFYRGPVWDFDSIMLDNPESMIADTRFRQPFSSNDYYYYLNQRKEFRSRCEELFETVFRPLIKKYTDSEIDQISNRISKARETDAIRWGYHISSGNIYDFKNYLLQKADFMEEYWADREKYCKVLVQDSIFYRTFMVEKGKTISDALNIDMSFFEDNEYQDADTGERFEIDQQINEDIRLDLISEEKEETIAETSFISRFGILNIFFSVLFLFALLILIICVIIKNHG